MDEFKLNAAVEILNNALQENGRDLNGIIKLRQRTKKEIPMKTDAPVSI